MKAAMAVRGEATLPVVSSPPRPGNLFDRDGTIIVDHGYVGSVYRMEFIAGAREAIAVFNQARGARTKAEVAIHVDRTSYGAVEDLHQGVMHALAQYIRQLRMTTNTISTTVF